MISPLGLLYNVMPSRLNLAVGVLNRLAPLCIQRADGTRTKLALSSASLGFAWMCCPVQQLLESREADRLDAATGTVGFVELPQLFRCSCCRLPLAHEGQLELRQVWHHLDYSSCAMEIPLYGLGSLCQRKDPCDETTVSLIPVFAKKK